MFLLSKQYQSWIYTMKTNRYECRVSYLQTAMVLAVIFALWRTVAVFLLWFQVRPDINQTKGRWFPNFEALLSAIVQFVSFFQPIPSFSKFIPTCYLSTFCQTFLYSLVQFIRLFPFSGPGLHWQFYGLVSSLLE